MESIKPFLGGPAAKCQKCGLVFEAKQIIGGAGSIESLVITGCEVQCRCGGTAIIGDAIYKYQEELFQLKSGDARTWKMFDRLQEIADRARANSEIKAEELLAEVSEVNPDLAKKLRSRLGLRAAAIILALYWLIKSVSLNIEIDVSKVIDQVHHLSKGEDPEQHYDNHPPELPVPQEEPMLPAPTILAGLPSGLPSRQQLRHMQRQARKRKGKT